MNRQYKSKFDEYYKRYGKRPAMECYVRAMNDYFFYCGQQYPDKKIAKAKKELAALIIVSTASTIIIALRMKRCR